MLEKLSAACELINAAHNECKNQFIQGQIELIAMNLHVVINNAKPLISNPYAD